MTGERKSVSKLAGVAFDEALERLARTSPPETSSAETASLGDTTIDRLITRFEDASQMDDDGIEFWDARDLQELLGYANWVNFLEVVNKAKEACKQSGQAVANHFADVSKKVPIGSGAERDVPDIRLTRYACYLIAQNGDSRKKPIAFAQTYFAIQTRRQEIQDDDVDQYVPLSEDGKRLLLRNEIKEHNTKLASAAKGAGVVEPLDFAIFQNHGYEGLYGGLDRRVSSAPRV
jgi:DNA-damage-inducible protein D